MELYSRYRSLTQLSLCLIMLFLVFVFARSAWAVDIIKMNEGESKELDKRSVHKTEVLIRSLELTIPEYGPYEIAIRINSMNRNRALAEMIKGEYINVYVSAATAEWDNNTIAIKIPIRRGLLNYRLLLIHEDDLDKFSQVKTLADLNELTAGLRTGWVTTDAFHNAGMQLQEVHNFEGLFPLLELHRFNYIPRAIYEIFDELEARKHFLKHVVIEPTLAIYLPSPTYVYVSSAEPRIAQRIEKGLRVMLENGELEQILNKYYEDDIQRGNLKARKIIKIDSTYPIEKSLLEDKTLWHQW